jgi:DNA-binding NarL/FixJ family response regulator
MNLESEDVRAALKQVVSETLDQLLAQIVVPRAAPPAAVGMLTAREREILGSIARGDSNNTIARTFDLSVHTVKRHVANILAKLGISSRLQAATWLHARH